MSVHSLDDLFAPTVESIGSTEPASHAKRRMDTSEARSLLVVDNGHLVGIIKRNSLLKASDAELERPVADHMDSTVPTVTRTQSVEEAHASLGGDINIEQVPVLDESGQLVGVVNRSSLTEASAASRGASTAAAADPVNRAPVHEGMTVKDSSGSNLGTLKEADFKANGDVEFMVIEHGLIFKKQKRLPGELVRSIEGDELHLALDSNEFGMMKDIGEE